VKFSDVDAARRAINDLNGRFFGGRIVTAAYFDNGRFDRLDLAPTQQEFYLT
jgi:splicing factor 45